MGIAMMRSTLKSLCVSTVFLLAASGVALGQGVAAGSVELAGNVGFSSIKGVDNDRHVVFGGSGAYNLSQLVAIGFEYSYNPLGSLTEDGATGSEHLQLYGPVARFSLAESSRVVPYVLVAAGGSSLDAVASDQNVSLSAAQRGYYFGAGGGVTLYVGSHWGIRPEFRYERQQFNATTIQGFQVASFGQNEYQGSAALFYQFGGTQRMRK
jgi:hypothetical protein